MEHRGPALEELMDKSPWRMNDDMAFEMDEEYEAYLKEAKHVATVAWCDGLFGYLEERTHYTKGELADTFNHYANRFATDNEHPVDITESFIVSALEGDL